MIDGKKVVVVFPAYNAAKTLEKTYKELPFDIVDETILVDDASKDVDAVVGSSSSITSHLHSVLEKEKRASIRLLG